MSNSNLAFSTDAIAVTVVGHGSQNIEVTFTPTEIVNYDNLLTIKTTDPLHSTLEATVVGSGVTSGELGNLFLRSSSVSSSKVSIAWDPYAGAEMIKIYVGSEPPTATGDDLPIKKLVATLSGSATSYQLTGLAAATNVFIRAEALAGGTVLASGNVAVKTIGGPKANLDFGVPLREAHLVAPDIIELVLVNKVTSYDDSSDPYNYTRISSYNGQKSTKTLTVSNTSEKSFDIEKVSNSNLAFST
ncbi:MAG: hypothetical protein UV64_C0016G0001, partial [Parcubacteria group bacterium GW2011_GWC1_43_11b]